MINSHVPGGVMLEKDYMDLENKITAFLTVSSDPPGCEKKTLNVRICHNEEENTLVSLIN